MKISPARRAAFDVLLTVEKECAFTSVLLPDIERELSGPDRGLCHELVLGTLRNRLLLDRYIELFTDGRRLDPEVRIALELGLFQLYFLERVPQHAAVNESVELVQRSRKSSARGLVNAVLRKASRSGPPELTYVDELERTSVETSHPLRLLERWVRQFGLADAMSLAAANNSPPPVTFRRTLRGSGKPLSPDFKESDLVTGCYFADRFDDDLRSMAESGDIYFQDAASQVVAGAVPLRAGGSFLDVCAAPGGKTTQIAGRAMRQAGNDCQPFVIAGDVTRRRVELLKSICERHGAGFVEIVRYDAEGGLPFADGAFDSVLVDAPCTGTGTIRHNPEIRYFITVEEIRRMQQIQTAILSNAAKAVAPGGTLIYSTCSLEAEENEDVCDEFLAASSGFRKVRPAVPERFLTGDGFARTFPHRDGMDGFFIATFERVGDTNE